MIRLDALDARFWEAIVDGVIREDHLENALRDRGSGSESESDRSADLIRLEAGFKRLSRAEEILLARFGRGLVSETALDKELLVLSKERVSVGHAIESTRDEVRRRSDLARDVEAIRTAAARLRDRLRLATREDRRDIIRAIVDKGESGVILGLERIEARVLLALPDDVAFAQAYSAG